MKNLLKQILFGGTRELINDQKRLIEIQKEHINFLTQHLNLQKECTEFWEKMYNVYLKEYENSQKGNKTDIIKHSLN